MGKIPRGVQAQIDRANEVLKKLGEQNPNPAAPPAVNTPAAPAVVAPVTPDPPTLPITPAPPELPVAPVPVTQDPPATPPEIPPTPAPCSECAKWQQRYAVLQGKYDAEVPRYASRVQYLENQMVDMHVQLEAKAASPAATPQAPASPGKSFADVLRNSTDEKIKGFQDHFPDVFEMVVDVVDRAASTIRQDTETKFSALEKNTSQDRQGVFAQALNVKHPGWSQMSQDPSWAFWLAKKDRYSSRQRLDLLKDASQNLDAEAVINLLDDFRADMAKTGAPPPPSTPTPPTQPAAPATPFVTPPSGTPSAPSIASGPGDGITRSFINQFYQDKVRGRYRGRDDVMNKIQTQIDVAVSSGKVINR